jgi:DNA-binding MarR family transcriptional regulator
MTDLERDLDALVAGSVAGFGFIVQSLAPTLGTVSMPQYRLLVLLVTQGPMRSGDLAHEIGVLPSGVTRLVNRLIRDGYATKKPGEQSRREVVVTATANGEELVRDAFARRRQQFRDFLSRMSAEDRDSLVRACRVLAATGTSSAHSRAAQLSALPATRT